MSFAISEWLSRGRQMLRTRYVRLLEDELERSRGEVARQRADNERLRREWAALAARAEEEMAALRVENRAVINSLLGTAGVPPIETPRAFIPTPPVRRRSWPQIATTREIEAARADKKHEREKQASRAETML